MIGVGLLCPNTHELAIDLGRADRTGARLPRVGEQVIHPFSDQYRLPERDRPVLLDDDCGVSAHGLEPLTELLGIADRGRERHQPDGLGQGQDDLFPHPAAEAVSQVIEPRP